MSVIIDGMDQSKASLPHLKKVNKSAANLWRLRTHITGVIVHGHGSEGYVDFLQWPHDPNLTIDVLLRVLKEYLPQIAKSGGLPAKLYLQLDNCVRENKNKFVLTFLALLVEQGVFQEVSYNKAYWIYIKIGCHNNLLFVRIELGFLMVGHTHEDVDALFGHIST